MNKERKAGVLMPVSALPGRHGIGSFGKESFRFVDDLSKGGYKLWQILPLNPLGYGHSPYQPFSSYAMDDLYIDLDLLAKKGLIKKAPDFNADCAKTMYEDVKAFKSPYLFQAFKAEMKKHPYCLDSFKKKEPWVKDFGVFMMLKKRNGMISWGNWPMADRDWVKRRTRLTKEEKEGADYEIWLQKTLYSQWGDLHAYANKKGIKIIGDVPFYVGHDSCDVWTNQDCFLLNEETLEPDWIAGVPPDYFSATGQRWGNPIYDWDHLKETGYAFLENRIVRNSKIYDIIRLDHFRAFDTYWKIPSSCPTAVDGAWIEAPGYEFFDIVLKKVSVDQIIAEDLGDLRPEVLVLRDHYDFPGMNVIEFTFNDSDIEKKPGNDWNKENMIAYLGTHDNDTFKGYFEKLNDWEKGRWLDTVHSLGYQGDDISKLFYEYALGKKCYAAVLAMQDILGLGSETRINVPGIIDDVNWTWRMTSLKPFEERIAELKALNEKYGR